MFKIDQEKLEEVIRILNKETDPKARLLSAKIPIAIGAAAMCQSNSQAKSPADQAGPFQKINSYNEGLR